MFHKNPNKGDFQHILDNLKTKLSGWKTNTLSMAGRVVLAKSCLESMQSPTMSYIRLPSKITKDIDKITRDFLWGTCREKKKMHLLNWATITTSKDQGGLGLQRSEIRNKVILNSLAWRIAHHQGSLWAKILINKHKSSPYNTHASRMISRTWKNIQMGWAYISNATRWVAHQGTSINFFTGAWLPNTPSIRSQIHGPLLSHEEHYKLSDIYKDGLWHLDTIPISIPDALREVILYQPICLNPNKENRRIYELIKDGKFLLSTAYRYLQSKSEVNHFADKDFEKIWHTYVQIYSKPSFGFSSINGSPPVTSWILEVWTWTQVAACVTIPRKI